MLSLKLFSEIMWKTHYKNKESVHRNNRNWSEKQVSINWKNSDKLIEY